MDQNSYQAEASARALLKLHGGSCSVPHSSPMHRAFMDLAMAGEVTMVTSSTPGQIDIYRKGFKARFSKKTEKE